MWKYFILACLQLLLALLLAVGVTYLTFRLFQYFWFKRAGVPTDNISSATLLSAGLLSVAYILSGVIQPLLNVIRTIESTAKTYTELILRTLQYLVLFVGLGLLIAFLVNVIGLYLFTQLTQKIDELEEIRKDNRAVGLLTGAIIIVLALFLKDSAVNLLEALIPYPNIPFRN